MLVDNGVKGDSRVQKQARSAADAGWEVVLLGMAPGQKVVTWKLGEADVRLVPMPRTFTARANGWVRRKASGAKRRVLGAKPPAAAPAAAQPAAAAAAPVAAAAPRKRRLDGIRTAGEKVTHGVRRGWDNTALVVYKGVLGDRAWQRLDPQLWKFEVAFGHVIDSLKPDLIHANDFRMLGVGARATRRLRAAGHPVKLVWDAHEFLPGLNSWVDNPRWLPAQVMHERYYAREADAVVTVSERLAEMLQQEHRLPALPAVVLNAPNAEVPDTSGEQIPDLRESCGVGPDVPLLVYSGAAAPQRGCGIMIEALPHVPKAHVVYVVGRPQSGYMKQLMARAEELGVADRVHMVPYVQHWQVVRFLSGADVGVIPNHHFPNNEISLNTKFFEYSHARLPLVVSDVKIIADTTRSTGQGEVFRAGDLTDYLRALDIVLADTQTYRSAYDKPGVLEKWTWEAQARVLDDVYARLLPGSPPARN
ncbi:glycosyltransferase family 4 protein [Catellatospora methionotrophica]|uniref:glycosyltransferase family 4 protein n=1 Tax=Catellatospora methionotrophica TaxID=121620 RepID=UPI00140C8137